LLRLNTECDYGPPRVWHKHQAFLYAFLHKELKVPIAIAEASVRPRATAGWWVDSQFRGQGYGNEVVDLLATYLKADGVTEIGSIPIDTHLGKYNERSIKLAQRFRARFAENCAS
jgi:RimJ/RimL family protein N-acetyltransferase